MEALKTVWNFIQDEVLGMNWLDRLLATILNAVGLDTTGKIGSSIHFFIYDTIKIMVLLGVVILIISYIQSYFPPERTKKILGRFHGIGANIVAALLGTVTPFCSCSSIPLFIGFTSAGLPLGVTFSFLISSPMVDLGSLVLLMSILATVAGIPMYADIFGTIPIAEALLAKGALLGVVLSFMMGVTTLSLPSMIMLRKAVKPKLLAIFIGVCTVGIIVVGYFFNLIQPLII